MRFLPPYLDEAEYRRPRTPAEDRAAWWDGAKWGALLFLAAELTLGACWWVGQLR